MRYGTTVQLSNVSGDSPMQVLRFLRGQAIADRFTEAVVHEEVMARRIEQLGDKAGSNRFIETI